ncbi:hypothetical protein BDY19DRAFT_993258 [Irpex rosettiformis]|uniref:Uncharacterized protein n=1 Tax=Irpex rosettiformis TaxID=378272 RepID=A0ACB8U5N1_9APHY|nr:hypothetical protein BDY19DRAFT_993258 [Irpex rosettiformis]
MDAPPPLTLWIAASAPTEKLFSVQIDGSATIDELAAEISRRDSRYNPTGLALFKCRNLRLEPRSTLFSRIHEKIDYVTSGSHSRSSNIDSVHLNSALSSENDESLAGMSFERLKEYKSVRHYFSSTRHVGRVDVLIDVENILPDTYEEEEHSHGVVSLVKGMFNSSNRANLTRSQSSPRLSNHTHAHHYHPSN